MQFKYSLGVISLCSALFLVGCNDDNSSASQTPTVQEQKQKLQPIIIQGALPVESEKMASKLELVLENMKSKLTSSDINLKDFQLLFIRRSIIIAIYYSIESLFHYYNSLL